MVKSCCAPTKLSKQEIQRGVRYHFTDFQLKERRAAWIAFLNRKNLPNLDFTFICGEHFITGKYYGFMCFQGWEPIEKY